MDEFFTYGYIKLKVDSRNLKRFSETSLFSDIVFSIQHLRIPIKPPPPKNTTVAQ